MYTCCYWGTKIGKKKEKNKGEEGGGGGEIIIKEKKKKETILDLFSSMHFGSLL